MVKTRSKTLTRMATVWDVTLKYWVDKTQGHNRMWQHLNVNTHCFTFSFYWTEIEWYLATRRIPLAPNTHKNVFTGALLLTCWQGALRVGVTLQKGEGATGKREMNGKPGREREGEGSIPLQINFWHMPSVYKFLVMALTRRHVSK